MILFYNMKIRYVNISIAGVALIALAVSGFGFGITQTDAAPGLTAGYAFDATSGTSAVDASPNNITGTLTNGPTWVVGKNGNAVNLDGVNDYVNLGNPTLLRMTGSMTISAWVNAASFPGVDSVIVSKRNSGVSGYQLDMTTAQGSRAIGFKLTNSSSVNMARYGATTLQANTWYHLAGVYDASAKTMTVYVNGQLDNGVQSGTITSSQKNSTQNVNIGRKPGASGSQFAGKLDDARIYSRALTQAEIQADMNSTLSIPPDTIAPTVSITSPAANATVSGTISVSATAADTVGVAGVQFLLDGVNLGVEDITAPYAVSWDTPTSANGSHALSARARDAALNTTISAVVPVAVSNSATSGAVAAYAFSEGSGSIAGDSSGNAHTGTLVNGPTWTAGKYGTGLSFDGTNDYATIGDLDMLGAFTVSLWGVVNNLSSTCGSAVMKRYDYGFEFCSGVMYGQIGNGVGPGWAASTQYSVPQTGVWNYYTLTYDGATAKLFVNGSQVSSASGTHVTNNNNLMFGSWDTGSEFYNGMIDEVRIYNRAITLAEIQTDMNTPISGGSPSDPLPPQVSITVPVANAQVADIVTITADASDNVGVVGVQFFVDAAAVGLEDTDVPYGVNWDTRTVSNGAHNLTARARDAAGNVTLSTAVAVNVSNTNYFQNEILATGLNLPTNLEFLPDGRMLVGELQGTIKLLLPPYTQAETQPFLQLTNVGSAGVQQGIYDMVLDPDFVNNHFYYVFYTAGTPNRDRVSRFTANVAITGTVSGSETVLYQDPQDANAEHHGGALNFGNDGKLYFTTGEHFNAADSPLLTSPRGKVHRINKDGTIPTDNPFYDGAGPNVDSIWARGLRNPFRAYYDAPTGRFYIADVGGNDYSTAQEEVNVGVAGADYGWPSSEGNCSLPCTSPLYAYRHNGRDASITGGFVYHGTQFPALYQGSYFFADYTQNWIRRLALDANGAVTGVYNFEPIDGSVDGPYGDIVYLAEGPDGALYYVDLGYSDIGGTFGISKIRRIRYVQTNQAPVAVASANQTSGPLPLSVNFSSAGSLDPEGQPLSYVWTFGDNSTSTAANPTHVYTVAGQYTVRLSVSDGVNSTLATPIFVNAGNRPTATVLTPQNGIFFRAGDVISFSGNATDTEDGTLPASAYSWTINFLHEGHVHPGLQQIGVTSGSFTVPTTGHDFSGNTRYEIRLTVTDSNGLQDSKAVIVYPEKVNLSFVTVPTGLTILLDGISHGTPFVYDTLVNFIHTIEAPTQTQGANTYNFSSWSDLGAQQHSIIVPSATSTYTATYSVVQNPIPAGLVAGYTFNEGTGTSAGDRSGNGNTATLLGGTSWAAGKYGQGLSFDGVNDYLSILNSASTNISGNGLTLSMWVNPQQLTGSSDSVVIGKFWNTSMTSPYYQYGLEFARGNEPYLYIGQASGGLIMATMGTTLQYGTWSHLAITFDGVQAKFYLNGALVATKTAAVSITARGNALNIGADVTPMQFVKGALDEVRIYNRALSAAEVVTDMNTQ